MKFIASLLILSFLIAGTAHAAKPQIQWNPDYDFSSIQSFEWIQPPEASLVTDDPYLHEHIINAIQYQLTSRGVTEVSENGDVRVTYYMSTRTDVSLQSTTVGYGFSNYGRRGWGYYGYGFGGPVYTNTSVVEVDRGTLMVDIWDSASNELIWRGKVDDISLPGNQIKVRRNVESAIKAMAKQADKLRKKAR